MKTKRKAFTYVLTVLITTISMLLSSTHTIKAAGSIIPSGNVYDSDLGTIGLNFEDKSINNHTRVSNLWIQDGYVYIAVASTHKLESISVDGVNSLDLKEHAEKEAIIIDGTERLPKVNLNGNVGNSRWTIAAFPKSIATTDGVYPIIVIGIGGGHDVSSDFKVIIPKITATVNKTWVGGLKAPIEVELIRRISDGSYEKAVQDTIINPVTLTANTSGTATYTWSNLNRTDGIGRIFEYSISEISGSSTYTSTLSSTYNDSKLLYTFNLVNTYSKVINDLVVEKRWSGGISEKISVNLYRQLEGSETVVLLDTIDLDGIVNVNSDGSGELVPWKYTFKNIDFTNDDGLSYTYTIDEEEVPLNFIKSVNNDSFIILNTYVSPKTSVTVNKVWVNGPSNHPDIDLQLYQNGIPYQGVVKLISPKTSHTWSNLDLTDQNGLDYVYTVDEINNLENYTKSISNDTLTITNTYVIPKTDITVSKVWVEGPDIKPNIELQLYRNNEKFMDSFTLSDGEVSRKFENLDKTDINGVEYIYRIDEVKVPDNYIKSVSEDGLTITNTYKSALTDIKGTKVWDGGPSVKESIKLQLLRNGLNYLDPVELIYPNTSYTWSNLAVTDENGIAYLYTIDEVVVPDDYIKTIGEDGLTVVNTYISPLVDITANKVWIGGLDKKESITLQLYRDGIEYLDEVVLLDGVLSHTWNDLAERDHYGNPYVYTIDEINVPENYIKEISEDGLTITNTYVSPVTSITGTKVWIGGPSNHPDIQLQLYRNGEPLHTPATISTGNTEFVWSNLPLTDSNGLVYTYTVDEVVTPENYVRTRSGNGFTIENRYVSLKTEVSVSKVWIDGPEVKPTITLQLFRDNIAYLEPVQLKNGVSEYSWKELDVTDENGNEYVYSVDELDTPENYVKEISKDGFVITNTYVTPFKEVSAKKEWIGGPEVKPTISLQLYRDGIAYLDPVELLSGDSIAVWSKVPTTDKSGNEYTYTVDELITPENYHKQVSEDGLTITNTYVSPKVDILGTKVWVDGPKTKPTIKLQLLRDGIAHLEPIELVDGTTTHTWLDLDETDTDGKHYVYSIDEIDVDKNYSKEVSEDGLTVTNTYIPDKIVKANDKPKTLTPVTGVRTYDNLFYTHILAISMFGLLLLLRKRRDLN